LFKTPGFTTDYLWGVVTPLFLEVDYVKVVILWHLIFVCGIVG